VILVFLRTILLIDIPIVFLAWLLPVSLMTVLILMSYLFVSNWTLFMVLAQYFGSARGEGRTISKNQTIRFIKDSENCFNTLGRSLGIRRYIQYDIFGIVIFVLLFIIFSNDPRTIVAIPFILFLPLFTFFVVRRVGKDFLRIAESR